jgi:hypothetical protein
MIAQRDGNENLRQKLARFYGVRPEDLHCEGCKSEVKAVFCQVCGIRACTEEKGFQSCHQCQDWPCDKIENFPVPVGKRVIMRAIPTWRNLGTEKYVELEDRRYHCPECGQALFRGTKRCNECGVEVDLDG